MQAKFIVAFDQLNEADFQTKAGVILAALTSNPDFPEPWPAPVPSLAQVQEAYAGYREAYHASLTRDRLKIVQRNEARQVLTRMLQQLATYLELMVNDDLNKANTCGFDLRRSGGRPSVNVLALLDAPKDFRVGLGPRSGTLQVQATRLSGAIAYEIHTNQGDPAVDDDWKQAVIVPSARRILVEGLKPGQVWTRLRGIGSAGGGYWSSPISLMVA